MAAELKTNNMARTPYKMKSSPAKGKLGDFFKGLGASLGAKETDIAGDYAEKKSRKAGESKYQADVRRGREKRKDYKKRTSGIDPSNKTKMVNVVVDGVVKSVPAEDRFKYESVRRAKSTPKTSKTSKPPKTSKQTFKQAFASASQAGKKTFDWNGNPYTTELKKKKVKKTNKYKTIKGKHGNVSGIDDETTESLPTWMQKPKFEPVVTEKPEEKTITEESEEKVISRENFYSKDHPRFDFTKTRTFPSTFKKKSPTKRGIGNYSKGGYKMKRK